MVITLKNSNLTVQFSTLGGSLSSIKDKDGIEYLWQGDATYWSGQAPVLFPICGSLREEKAYYPSGQWGSMPRHGLVRKREFELVEQTEEQVVFATSSDAESLAHYPYGFELKITYTLDGSRIRTAYEVTNLEAEQELPYFIGGHPGFNCPLLPEERYEDYYLFFAQEETCTVPTPYPETGLLDILKRQPFLDGQQTLDLTYDLFSRDAITFDQLISRHVSLLSRKNNKGLRLEFEDFPYLVVWSTVNQGPFVALEPWSGLSTSLEEGDEFVNKPGVTMVSPGKTDCKSFTIDIL